MNGIDESQSVRSGQDAGQQKSHNHGHMKPMANNENAHGEGKDEDDVF